jgi:integrase
VASIQKRPNGKWRARYRDPSGKEHAAHFDRKADAQRWLDQVTADIVRGVYVDPRAGRVLFGAFAREWLAAQTFNPSTREAVEVRLRVHILPTLGDMELGAIRPSTVQAWLRSRQEECSPRYVKTMLAHVSSILGAAVEDGLIARNPCASKSVKAPRAEQGRIVPWTADQVAAVVAAHPLRYRAVPVTVAVCGLRQGEVFGLRVQDVDFLRRRVLVRQQVKLLSGQPVLASPKGGKAREVPLPEAVAVALAERLRKFSAGPDGLVFTSRERRPLIRTYYNPHIWKPALQAAGIAPTRENGMHALRHFYASVLLDGGESIRTLAEYLGHADPGFTLRVYTHLIPSSEDRARAAIDRVLGGTLADSMRTATP